MDKLEFESEFSLRKLGAEAEQDEWSVNEWDAEVPISNFDVIRLSENVVARKQEPRRLTGQRKEHFVTLSAPGNASLAEGEDDLEFTLTYSKPLTKGLNYEIVNPLPYLDLHLIRFDPFRVFNPCGLLRYRVVDHSEMEVIASVPSRYCRPTGAIVFEKRDMQPDETYSLCVVMAKRGLTGRLARGVLKPLVWLALQTAK